MQWKAVSLLVGIALAAAGLAGLVTRRAETRDHERRAVELAASLAATRLDASIARVETTLLLAAADAEVGRLADALGLPVCARAARLDCAGGPERLLGAYDSAVAAGARESRRSGAPTAVVVADGAAAAASAIVVVADQPDRVLLAVLGLDDHRVVPTELAQRRDGSHSAPLAHDFGGTRWWVQVDEGAAPSLASGVGWTIAVEVAAGAALVAGSVAGLLRDQRRLRRRASTDSLTGLPNRAEFERRAARLLGQLGRDGRGACLIVIDLDGFKSINDSSGHAAGDRVLAEASTRLAAAVRSSDLVGRWGGDEFVLLLAGISDPLAIPERAAAIAACLHDVPRESGGPLTASVGAAMFPADGRELATLLDLADRAMYAAKGARAAGTPAVP